MIALLLKTLWDHTDGCAKKYHCASAIYLLSCLALEFSIIIDRELVESGHGKYMVYGMNDIYKWMLKLAMENI